MTMKTKKTLQHIAAVAVVLLMLCLVFAAPVSADPQVYGGVAYVVPDGVIDENNYTTLADALESDASTIILKAGHHYSTLAQQNGNAIVISRSDIVIKGEDKSSTIYHTNVKEDATQSVGFAIGGVNVTFEDFTIIVDTNQYSGNAIINAYGDNFVMDRCIVNVTQDAMYVFDTDGDDKITIRDSTFINSGSSVMWTVYSGYYASEHTKLLTFTGNTITGKFMCGLDQITGNYVINGNIFNIENPDDLANGVGVIVTPNELASDTNQEIKDNTFASPAGSLVRILPLGVGCNTPSSPVSVTATDDKIPVITGNTLTNADAHVLDISLARTHNLYAVLAEIPSISVDDNSGGSAVKAITSIYNPYQELGSVTVGEYLILQGVNLPGSTWDDGALTLTQDGMYKLGGNLVLSDMINITTSVTLDLNGYNISATSLSGDKSDALFAVNRGGELTIEDSSSAKTGIIDGSLNGEEIYAAVKMTIYGEPETGYVASLTINGGTLKGYYYGIVGNGGREDTEIIINGGTITSSNGDGIYHPQDGTLTINGGTIIGEMAVYFKSGTLTITGGSLTGTGEKASYIHYGNGFFTTGDALVIENVNGGSEYEKITSVSITGGTFMSKNAAAVASYIPADNESYVTDNDPYTIVPLTEDLKKTERVTGFIKGGTFSSNPSAYIAPGMEVVQPGDKYLVQVYVDRSSSGGSSSAEPEEPEQPEEPVVEPETPAAPGEVASSTEVTDGGDVTFETPAGEDGTAPAAADDEVKGVVLPTGTEGTVEFVPVSEQPAPAGQEENTKRVFEINIPSYKKGEASVIKFQMTVAEIEADGKTAADVALWHYDEETGEWTKLVTSFIIKDGIVYFEAITNDFSPFAIVYADEPAEELPTDQPEEPTETPASPAPVLAVIAALGAAVVLRRK